MRFISQADIEREVRSDFEIILHVSRDHIRALSPGSGPDAPAEIVGQAEEEIGFSRASAAAGTGQRIRARRVPAAKSHKAGAAVVAGIESVDPLPQKLKSRVPDMP